MTPVNLRRSNKRLALFMGFAVVFLVALFARTFYVQVVAAPDLQAKGQEQYSRTIKLDAPRGIIYDRDGYRAGDLADHGHACMPIPGRSRIRAAAEALAPILGSPGSSCLEKLSEDSGFKYLVRKIEAAKGEKVKALDLDGIFVCAEDKRVYPTGALAPQVLGFVGTDEHGPCGAGEGVRRRSCRQSRGPAGGERPVRQQAVDDPSGGGHAGDSITLTIDKDIQFEVEKVLSDIVEEFEAKKACAVVIEPRRGEILAMANTPVFDTNDYTGRCRRTIGGTGW